MEHMHLGKHMRNEEKQIIQRVRGKDGAREEKTQGKKKQQRTTGRAKQWTALYTHMQTETQAKHKARIGRRYGRKNQPRRSKKCAREIQENSLPQRHHSAVNSSSYLSPKKSDTYIWLCRKHLSTIPAVTSQKTTNKHNNDISLYLRKNNVNPFFYPSHLIALWTMVPK
jgi:hypothetical protein